MNKKFIITIITILVAVIIGGIIYNNKNNINSDSYLASKEEERSFVSHRNTNCTDNSISFEFKEFNGKWSFFDLTVQEGANISIEDKSDISKGELYLVVLDTDYNLISKKKVNGKDKLEFSSKNGGNYLLRAVGDKASGDFAIKVSSNDEFSLRYRDFF